jgi:hypothetical protein
MLEPVAELAELVGYRSIRSRDDTVEPQSGHGMLIDRFDEVLAARRARSEQADLEAEHWLDDGGSFSEPAAAAVAVPPKAWTHEEPET